MKKQLCVAVAGICCAGMLAGCGAKDLPLHPGNLPDAGGHSAVYQAAQQANCDEHDNPGKCEAVNLVEEFTRLEIGYTKLMSKLDADSTQAEMNVVATEANEYWAQVVNNLWKQYISLLTEEDGRAALKEQQAWSEERDAKAADAGNLYEGGSLQPYVVNITSAELTRERCYVIANLIAVAKGEVFPLEYTTDTSDGTIEYVDKQGTSDVYSDLVMRPQDDNSYMTTISLHRLTTLEGIATPKGNDTYDFVDDSTGVQGEIRINTMEECGVFEVTQSDTELLEAGNTFEFPDHN